MLYSGVGRGRLSSYTSRAVVEFGVAGYKTMQDGAGRRSCRTVIVQDGDSGLSCRTVVQDGDGTLP